MLNLGLDYIEKLTDRAMFLDITDGDIDDLGIVKLRGSKLCLDLNKLFQYIDYSSLEKDEYGYVIDIPDNFYAVFVNVLDNTDKCYHIIFPKNIIYVGSLNGFKTNTIRFGSLTIDNTSELFKNSFLDFSACVRLNSIYSYGMAHMIVKRLDFGPGITEVRPYAFDTSVVDSISFINLRNASTGAFRDAKFREAEFGNNLVQISSSVFAFTTGAEIDEVRIAYPDIAEHTFQGVKNIYMPYDIKAGIYDIKSELEDILKEIRYDKVSYTILLDRLEDFMKNKKQEEERYKFYYKINDLFYRYVNANKEKMEDYAYMIFLSCMDCLLPTVNGFNVNFYFYDSEYSLDRIDVHDREYEKVYEQDGIRLYLEPCG